MHEALAPALAHAGGFSWDEALLVMAPIAVVAGLLYLANNRAKRLGQAEAPPDSAPTGAPAATPVPEDPA